MGNFGSLLGVFLVIQLISGLILSFHYSPFIGEAFKSVVSISDDISSGWLVRFTHANGASFFFICVFAHIGRGLLVGRYGKRVITWVSGVSIFLLLMGTAFLGYVLPGGQMSYWGATVITNLLSTLPWGRAIVTGVGGGFSVRGPTLARFFSLHYVLPFLVAVLGAVHIISLHGKGRENPLGVRKDADKIFFHPMFTVKDLLGVVLISLPFVGVALVEPDVFMDPDNFTEANSMSTPPHIQPEGYFLFAYAILRSIPRKLGGVVALVCAVVVLFILPVMSKRVGKKFGGKSFDEGRLFCTSSWGNQERVNLHTTEDSVRRICKNDFGEIPEGYITHWAEVTLRPYKDFVELSVFGGGFDRRYFKNVYANFVASRA